MMASYVSFTVVLFLPIIFFLCLGKETINFLWRQDALHAALEALGAFLAFGMAFILWQRRYENDRYGNYRFALGFLCMGILDFFHAITSNPQSFIFLHSFSNLLGSFLFILIWLPRIPFLTRRRSWFAWIVVLFSIGIGAWAVWFPQELPAMVRLNYFTSLTAWLNFIAGFLFILTAIYFVHIFTLFKIQEMYFFGYLCLLFGIAEIAFPFSALWNEGWWLWNCLRLAGYLLALGNIVLDYRKMVLTLEERLIERNRLEQDLQRQAGFLKDILESVSQPLCVIDAKNYTIKLANAAASAAAKASGGVNSCYGLMYQRKTSCEGEHCQCPLANIKKTKKPMTVEHIHEDEKGNRRFVEVHAYPILDEKDNVNEIIEYSFDITDRKQAEEALKESEEKFRGFADNSPNVFILIELQNAVEKIIYVNPAFEKLLGYSAQALFASARLWMQNIYEEDRPRVVKMFEDFLYGNSRFDAEYRVVLKGGSVKWIHDAGFKIASEAGQPARIGRIIQDITRKKIILDRLKEDEKRIRSIIQTTMDGFWIMDMLGQVLDANDAYCRMSGYTRTELLRLTLSDIEANESPDEIGEHIQRIIQKGSDRYETKHKKKDGAVFDVEVSINFLSIDGGIFVVFTRDITERKNIERRDRELIDAKANFVSMVTHELRTPLTAIKEGISIVLEGIPGTVNDAQKKFLDTSKRNVDRLHRLIDSVLDFEKLGSGKMSFSMDEHDLNDVVREIHNTMKLVTDQKELRFELELDESLPLVRFDRDKILQVLTNLLHNAIKFTDRGNITIKTALVGNVACISVADTGCGIHTEDMPRLFQGFQQLGNVKDRKMGGSGLGLAICQEIILRHHGRIWAESEFGKGTTFHFILPVKERRQK